MDDPTLRIAEVDGETFTLVRSPAFHELTHPEIAATIRRIVTEN
jgi:hypothetical protein